MSAAQTWLAAMIGLVGFLYVGVPLIALVTQKPRAHPRAVPLPSLDEAKGEDLDAGIALERGAAAIQALGFRTGLPVRVELSPRIQLFIVVGVAGNGDVAEACVMIQRHREKLIRHDWTIIRSFTQSFSQTLTSNVPYTLGIRPPAGQTTFQASGVKDVARLYALHELCVRDAGGRRRNPPAPEDHAAFVESERRRAHDNMCARGYACRRGPKGEALRPTLKGAFMMTWRHLPPMKQIVRERARRSLAEMEQRLARESSASRAA